MTAASPMKMSPARNAIRRIPKRIPETPANLEPDSPRQPPDEASAILSRPRGASLEDYSSVCRTVEVPAAQECPFYSKRNLCRCRRPWASIFLELDESEQRERPVGDEIPQRLPRADPVGPRKRD